MFFKVVRETGYLLLFVAVFLAGLGSYLLWGTGAITQRNQNILRKEIAHVFPSVPDLKKPKTQVFPQIVPVTLPPPNLMAAPQGSPIALLNIPDIGLSIVVVEGTDTNDLKLGPGHYIGTSEPGSSGNVAIAGHRTTYLHPFYNLNEVHSGSLIFLTVKTGTLVYAVTNIDVRSPDSLWVLEQNGTNELTLTSCNPRYSAATRLVVVAHLLGILKLDTTSTVSSTTSSPGSTPASKLNNGHNKTESTLLGAEQGSVTESTFWLGLVLLTYSMVRLAWSKAKGWLRWLLTLLLLIVLAWVSYVCFEQIASILPASF